MKISMIEMAEATYLAADSAVKYAEMLGDDPARIERLTKMRTEALEIFERVRSRFDNPKSL